MWRSLIRVQRPLPPSRRVPPFRPHAGAAEAAATAPVGRANATADPPGSWPRARPRTVPRVCEFVRCWGRRWCVVSVAVDPARDAGGGVTVAVPTATRLGGHPLGYAAQADECDCIMYPDNGDKTDTRRAVEPSAALYHRRHEQRDHGFVVYGGDPPGPGRCRQLRYEQWPSAVAERAATIARPRARSGARAPTAG